ncbi:MAG: BON domain-containing protein [Gammaproteobacteria bacterium]
MQTQKELVTALLAAFEKDGDINLHEYPIHITYRNTLKLEGQVANIIAKRKARRIALQLSGLSSVEDHLRLHPGEKRSGKALQDATVDALAQEPAFRDIRVYAGHTDAPLAEHWIGVSTEACVVRLDGQVGSLSHRRLAEVIAWWVPGSCDVRNHMRVRPAEKDNDDEISDAIRLVLEKDPLLHAETISASTHERVVTLEGYVHGPEQRRMAVYDCWYVPGVHDVLDHLRLLQ